MSRSNLKLLKSFRKNTEWYDNNYLDLKKYDGQFIAIYREGVIDSDNDYMSLIRRIKRLYDKSLYVTLVNGRCTVSPIT